MRNSICLLGLILGSGTAFGQYAADAFRYSEITQTGTARFQGIGGNHAALGGDASAVFGNPAGLGFYNRSELSITPSLSLANTEATYIGTSMSNSKSTPTLNHIGLVIAGNAQNENRRWRRTALGVTYNRQISFGNTFSFSGRNNVSSIVDSYIEDANARNLTGRQLDQEYFPAPQNEANFASAAAYQLYLINGTANPLPNDPDRTTPPYTRYDPNAPTDQRNTFESSGSASQWTFAYAGNLDDKFYIGASVGLARIRYEFNNEYRENVVGGRVFRSLGQTDDFSVSGSGINLALGVIYKVDPNLQLGASLTTPTFYSIRETFRSTLSTDAIGIPVIENGQPATFIPDNQQIDVVPNEFEYSLTSPLRASGGATYFLNRGKIGFITVSADYVGYSGMRASTTVYNSDDNAQFKNDVKREVQDTYKNTVNFRAGAEIRAGVLRVRAGAAYLPDPYKQQFDDIDRSKLLLSAGLGVRSDRFFADVSGTFNTFKSAYTPYTLNNPSDYASAQIDNRLTTISLTLGTFF